MGDRPKGTVSFFALFDKFCRIVKPFAFSRKYLAKFFQ